MIKQFYIQHCYSLSHFILYWWAEQLCFMLFLSETRQGWLLFSLVAVCLHTVYYELYFRVAQILPNIGHQGFFQSAQIIINHAKFQQSYTGSILPKRKIALQLTDTLIEKNSNICLFLTLDLTTVGSWKIYCDRTLLQDTNCVRGIWRKVLLQEDPLYLLTT